MFFEILGNYPYNQLFIKFHFLITSRSH